MCGFCGFTGDIEYKQDILTEMSNKIIHRGPDSSGFHIDDKVALGFRRLSIIDLNEGSQPIYNEDSTVVIVFNGEIYNHLELRETLCARGHVLKSHADTEVIIHGYEEYGLEIVNKLRGMFAFVIWDSVQERLFCARDFFGIKPFYYTQLGNALVFASEIKSILEHPGYERKVNHAALESYLSFQYSVLPETFFSGIFKLMPGHYMVYENGELTVTKYFQAEFDTSNGSIDDYADEIDKVMQESIQAHKISDVEVGSFLSSGVDSSYIAACFNGDKTFTVGFDYDKYNEIDYAKELSASVGIENHSKMITTQEYWDILGKVMYHMDEPLADPAAVALYFVSGVASEHVKVSLSGEGADEFFGGYNIYKEPISLRPVTKLPKPIRSVLGFLASAIPFSIKGKNYFIRASKTVEQRFIGNANMFSVKERRKILKATGTRSPQDITEPYYKMVEGKDDITKMQFIDLHLWMVGDILLKADKMSMAHSLEVRVPFLDKEVWKVASRVPVSYRVTSENTKIAMRLAASRHIPQQVADKKKLGFPVPIRIWLRDDKYYQKVRQAFCSQPAQEYFHSDRLVKLLDAHRAGRKDNSRKIWTVYMFLVWYQQYFAKVSS